MRAYGKEQRNANQPEYLASTKKWFAESTKPLGVMVERLGALVHFEIANHVANDKAPEDEARKRHQDFLADGCFGKTYDMCACHGGQPGLAEHRHGLQHGVPG